MSGCLCARLTPLLRPALSFAATASREFRFGVLGLFHPHELTLEQEGGKVLSVIANGDAQAQILALNGEPGRRQLVFRAEGGSVLAAERKAQYWIAAARDGGPTAFRLAIPGKIQRTYFGRLTILARDGELLAVAGVDCETAVASIVEAEMEESTPLEALKAQAVAARSFLAAGARHRDFDFCDTTHCQFIKSPPPGTARASRAAQQTHGLILTYRQSPVAALYSSRCGGQTQSLRDVGMEPGESYPFYAVPCAWCRQHPYTWRSRIAKDAAAPAPGNEGRRIHEARQWGWSAIPGSGFQVTGDNSGWNLEGHSIGHGIGMCQYGAAGMASSGAGFREILSHYYPNTSLTANS
jgi:stage II sporulation protein D